MYKQSSNSKYSAKLYSFEEVNLIIKNICSNLKRQLEDNQKIIRTLNQRLNANDIQINQLNNILLNIHQPSPKKYSNAIHDIIHHHQSTLITKLNTIISKYKNKSNHNQYLDEQIAKIKFIVDETIESNKKRNNSYWNSIKQSLTKIHTKMNKIQQRQTIIEKYITEFNNKYQQSVELKKCRRMINSFQTLKQSISNIHNTYQGLIQIQNQYKNNSNKQQIFALEYSRQQQPTIKQQHNKSSTKIKQLSPFKRPQQSSIISINSSNPLQSTTLVNLSMEARKQMSQNIKDRLLQLIQVKNIQIPILCYLDKINYLKNQDGNYIFDIKGNMFKFYEDEFKVLCCQGLLKYHQIKI